MHVRRRIERDLELAGDAHRRLGALLGGLDIGHLADGDTAVSHVRRRIQTARGGQLGLQLILADAHQRGNTHVVPAQHQQGHRRQDAEQDQLALDETCQHCRSALSTSGPPGASFGFGVYRTSGIIVAGSRPYDCSSARNAPENPVPVSHALSTADSVVSISSDEFMKSPRIRFGAVSRSNGAVKTNFNAPSKYGEALPSSLNGHCSNCRFWCNGARASPRYWAAAWLSAPTDSTASIRCF